MTENTTQGDHKPLPVSGYTSQPHWRVVTVNQHKDIEERLLRILDSLKDNPEIDPRWLAIGRSKFEEAFMAINRAVFKPTRIKLPEDETPKEFG